MDFFKRYKFWFGIGAGGVLAIVLLVFVWLPAARENRETLLSLTRRADELERDARGDIMSEEWIRPLEERKEALEELRDRVMSDLPGHYPEFGMRFSYPDLPEGEEPVFFDFRNAYRQKMTELEKLVQESFAEFPSDFLLRVRVEELEARHRDDPVSELHVYEKEYWVQKQLFDILIEQNRDEQRVPVLSHLSLDSPRTLGGRSPDMPAMNGMHRDSNLFAVWPFRIGLTLQLRYLTDLLTDFAESPLNIQVVSLSVTPQTRNEQKMVRADLRGYIPEYVGPRPETENGTRQ